MSTSHEAQAANENGGLPRLESEPIDLDRLVTELDDPRYLGELPVDAIRAAREHRDALIPRLIDLIRSATRRAHEGDISDGNGHLFALFLLTEFEARESLSAIIESMLLPENVLDELYGDVVTEYFSSALAALTTDSFEAIDALITDTGVSRYVRWAAADVFPMLVRDGRMSRDAALCRMRTMLREAIDRNDQDLVESLVISMNSLVPREALDEIREAFSRKLVDPQMITLEEIEESLQEGDEKLKRRLECLRPTGVEDTIEELQAWACFRADEGETDSLDEDDYDDLDDDDEWLEDWQEETEPSITIRNDLPKVGRNDPCPCGSGKKYKKCCGNT